MPLEGEYAPSSEPWVRDEVEHYERTGGAWRGRPVVVLTTRGATTGKLRKTPLMRVEHRGRYAVVASAAGAGRDPAWYRNVVANPQVELQDGAHRRDFTARELSGFERAAWWSRACTVFPSYATYQSRTRRPIPVLLLEPVGDAPARVQDASGGGDLYERWHTDASGRTSSHTTSYRLFNKPPGR